MTRLLHTVDEYSHFSVDLFLFQSVGLLVEQALISSLIPLKIQSSGGDNSTLFGEKSWTRRR